MLVLLMVLFSVVFVRIGILHDTSLDIVSVLFS